MGTPNTQLSIDNSNKASIKQNAYQTKWFEKAIQHKKTKEVLFLSCLHIEPDGNNHWDVYGNLQNLHEGKAGKCNLGLDTFNIKKKMKDIEEEYVPLN